MIFGKIAKNTTSFDPTPPNLLALEKIDPIVWINTRTYPSPQPNKVEGCGKEQEVGQDS